MSLNRGGVVVYSRMVVVLGVVLFAAGMVKAEHIPSQLPKGTKWKMVWSDEFDGDEIDTTKWDYRLHIMQTRHQTYTNTGARVEGGYLYLDLIERDGHYYSSVLQTGRNFMDRPGERFGRTGLTWPIATHEPPRFMHKYGYYEVRCKLQQQPGWWSAFWLQSPINGATPDPAFSGVEMDIMESFAPDNTIYHNVHWDGCGKDLKSRGSGKRKLEKSADGFHTFGLWWSKTNYVFYVDGKESWRVDDAPVSHAEQFILISTECKGYRQGKGDKPAPELKGAVLPDAFVVDYIRVFDEVE